jgi:hypothetical protein
MTTKATKQSVQRSPPHDRHRKSATLPPLRYALLAVLVPVLSAVWGIAPAAADLAPPPSIESSSVSNLTSTDATLEAQINSGGLEAAYEVRVETFSCQEEGGPGVNPSCESTGEGAIAGAVPAGSSAQAVSIDIAKVWHDLSPKTTYIYSISATDSAGEASSGGRGQFTTLASLPVVESDSVSNVTSSDATLEAQISPGGLETSYEFHLERLALCEEAKPPCETPAVRRYSYPLPSGTLLGRPASQGVSLDLNSAGVTLSPLPPTEAYEYWVTATNAAGAALGSHHRFITPSEPQGANPLGAAATTLVEPGANPLAVQPLLGSTQLSSAVPLSQRGSLSSRHHRRRHHGRHSSRRRGHGASLKSRQHG